MMVIDLEFCFIRPRLPLAKCVVNNMKGHIRLCEGLSPRGKFHPANRRSSLELGANEKPGYLGHEGERRKRRVNQSWGC